jgi:hypothetical protein
MGLPLGCTCGRSHWATDEVCSLGTISCRPGSGLSGLWQIFTSLRLLLGRADVERPSTILTGQVSSGSITGVPSAFPMPLLKRPLVMGAFDHAVDDHAVGEIGTLVERFPVPLVIRQIISCRITEITL